MSFKDDFKRTVKKIWYGFLTMAFIVVAIFGLVLCVQQDKDYAQTCKDIICKGVDATYYDYHHWNYRYSSNHECGCKKADGEIIWIRT